MTEGVRMENIIMVYSSFLVVDFLVNHLSEVG